MQGINTRFTVHDILIVLHARIVELQDQELNASPTVYAAGCESGKLEALLWVEAVLNGKQDEATEQHLRDLGVIPQQTTSYTPHQMMRVLRHWQEKFDTLSNDKRNGHHAGGGWIEYGQSVAYGHLAIMLQGHWDDKIAQALYEIGALERAGEDSRREGADAKEA